MKKQLPARRNPTISLVGRWILSAFAALIFLLSLAVIFHRTILSYNAPALSDSIVKLYRDFFDLDLSWNKFEIRGISDFLITGVIVKDIPTDQVLLTCDSMLIRSNFTAIAILRKNPMLCVTSTVVENPVLTLKVKDGKWNTGKLFEPGRKREEFPGRFEIKVINGLVQWGGGEIVRGFSLQPVELGSLNGDYVSHASGDMSFELEAILQGPGINSSATSIQGVIDSETWNLKMKSRLETLDLKLAEPYLQKYGFSSLTGVSDTNFSLLVGSNAGESGFSLLGVGSLSNASCHYSPYKLDASNISGDLHFSHRSLFTTGLTADINNVHTVITGRLGDFGNVSYNLAIDCANITHPVASRIVPGLKDFPFKGQVNAHIEISGFPRDLNVLVQAQSDSLSMYDTQFSLKDFLAWYSDANLTISHAQLGLFSGIIQASGAADFSKKKASYHIDGSASGISTEKFLSRLSPYTASKIKPQGALSAQFTISASEHHKHSITGTIESQDVGFDTATWLGSSELFFPFKYDEKGLHFDGACLNSKDLNLLFNGSYFSGKLNLSLVASSDDPYLIREASGIDLLGRLALSGDVSYSREAGFIFSGDAVLREGSFFQSEFQSISSGILVTSDSIHLTNLCGSVLGGSFDGEIYFPLRLAGNEHTDPLGEFSIKHLDISNLLLPPLSAMVSTSLNIDGRLTVEKNSPNQSYIRAELNVIEPGAKYGSNIITTSEGGISIETEIEPDFTGIKSVNIDGSLKVRPAKSAFYNGKELTPYGEELLTRISGFISGNADSNDGVVDKRNAPIITGTLSLKGNISDPLNRARGSIEISGSGLEVNDYKLERGIFKAGSKLGNPWEIEFAAFTEDEGSLEIKGEIELAKNIPDSSLALNVVIHDSGLNGVLDALGLSRFGSFSGSLSGSGSISGTLGSPVIKDFRINLGESKMFGIPLKGGGVSISYDSPILNLTSLNITGENDLNLLGAGSINVISPSINTSNIVLRLDQFDFKHLKNMLGDEVPITGIISGSAQLVRDALGSRMLFNATIEDASVSVRKRVVELGNISLEASTRPGSPTIDIDRLVFSAGEQMLRVSGTFPSSFKNLSPEFLNLEFVSNTGYSMVFPQTEAVEGLSWGGGLGQVDLKLSGFNMSGELGLDIQDIRYGKFPLAKAIKGILQVSGSTFTADPGKFKILGESWQLGIKGKANVIGMLAGAPGSVTFSVVPESDKAFSLTGPGYALQVRPGKDKDALGVTVQGALAKPSISLYGSLDVFGGDINLRKIPLLFGQNKPEAETDRVSLNFTANLLGNLRVVSGDDLNLIFNSGSLKIKGSTLAPELSGSLTAPTGYIDILGTNFNLKESLVLDFSSLNQLDPHVTALAEAKLREVRSPDNFGEELVITAKIDSRMSRMLDDVQLTSAPPLSHDELLAALAYEDIVLRTIGGSIFGDSFGAPGLQDLKFETLAYPIASSYISKYLRKEIGLYDFQFSVDPSQKIYISAEGEIFSGMVLYFKQTFEEERSEEFLLGLKYRWRPRSWVSLEMDEDYNLSGKLQYVIPFDLFANF